jgi:hypothetical protein
MASLAATPVDVTPVQIGAAAGRVYVKGADGRIWWRYPAAGSTWAPFNGVVGSGPSVLDASDEQGVAVFTAARGTAGDLLINFFEDGQPQKAWASLGGRLTSAPSIAVDDRAIYFAVRGEGGKTWVREFDFAIEDFTPWRSLDGVATSAPNLVWHPGVGVLATVRGSTGSVYQRSVQPGNNWVQVALPTINSRPEVNVTDTAAGPIMSYAWRGADNALYIDTQGGGRVKAGGYLTSGATIYGIGIPEGGLYREIYVRGADNMLWRYITDGQASQWEKVGGGVIS